MEWDLEWGPHAKALERHQQRGAKIAALDRKPVVPDYLLPYWAAYLLLSAARRISPGFGTAVADPVSYAEIEAYCRLYGWQGEDAAELAFFVRALELHASRWRAEHQGGTALSRD